MEDDAEIVTEAEASLTRSLRQAGGPERSWKPCLMARLTATIPSLEINSGARVARKVV